MHELSIALEIIDIAEEQARKAHAQSVTEIELEIGQLSGVEVDALNFALEVAVKDTMLSGAKRTVNMVSGQARCNDCTNEFPADDLFTPCPACHGFNTSIVRGQELRIKSLFVDDT
jgi:hydrogenase nickel incorporation protein HypA/HybF